AMTDSNSELFSRYAPERFQIALAGGVHHAGRQGRRRGLAIPATGAALGVGIIAQGLVVEGWLRPAWLGAVDRPEAGRVRRHHLVDQDNATVLIAAELEFCVCDDDALVAGELLAERIDRSRHAFERIGDLIADDLAHPRDRDVLVMTGLGFGR